MWFQRVLVLLVLLVLLVASGLCRVLDLSDWYLKTRTEAAGLPGPGESRAHQGLEGPRDPQQKEKFIKHLTGPLHFNPKCRKDFHRLYHGARDCIVPAYYKRCARLLVRLAGSPRCAKR